MINGKFSKLDAIKLFFSRNKEDFLWKHITSEEKVLSDMDVWQLADIILEASDHTHETERRKIVAEHKLHIRLSKIQARATWGAGAIGFIGAILGSLITIGMVSLFNPNKDNFKNSEEKIICEKKDTQSHNPIEKTIKPELKFTGTIKGISTAGVISIEKPIEDYKHHQPHEKHE